MQKFSALQMDFINKIITETGPRLPTSEEEREAATLIAEEFKKHTKRDSIIEEFECHPHATIGSIPIYGWIMLFVLFPLYIFAPLICIIAGLAMFTVAAFHIFKYQETFDFLFPKGKSQNVYSVLDPPSGDVKYSLIIGGHIDSSWGWNHALKNPKLMWVKVPYGIAGGAILLVLSLIRLLTDNRVIDGSNWWFILLGVVFIPGFIWLGTFLSYKKKKASPGAMDNLSGIAIALTMGKYFTENPDKHPEGCRIIVAGFGAEEAGLKGSSAFVKKHKDDGLMPNPWGLVVDSLADWDYFYIIKGDTWLGTKYDDDCVNFGLEAMKELDLKPATSIFNPVGGSDSAAFCRAGLRTCTIIAQDANASDYYHTKNDVVERMDPRCMVKGTELLAKMIGKIALFENQKFPEN